MVTELMTFIRLWYYTRASREKFALLIFSGVQFLVHRFSVEWCQEISSFWSIKPFDLMIKQPVHHANQLISSLTLGKWFNCRTIYSPHYRLTIDFRVCSWNSVQVSVPDTFWIKFQMLVNVQTQKRASRPSLPCSPWERAEATFRWQKICCYSWWMSSSINSIMLLQATFWLVLHLLGPCINEERPLWELCALNAM